MTEAHEIPPDAPIVCTIQPGDDEQEAIDNYRALFADALLNGERTTWGVRWTFREGAGIEDRVRALAAIEQACCAFLRMAITVAEGRIVWDVIGPRNAATFLDEYAQLPQTVLAGVDALRDRATLSGITVIDQRG